MPKATDTYGQFYAQDRKAWREWLEKHHANTQGIWLIYYKKNSSKTRVPYADAVEEALCFGWIDGQLRPGNEEFYLQLFTPRKEKSGWSKLNKERVEKLTAAGLMAEAGHKAINVARENGTWEKLDKIEAHEMPPEMEKALSKNKKAKAYFESSSPSSRKYFIYWITNAKLPATRAKRIEELINAFNKGEKPAHFNRPTKK